MVSHTDDDIPAGEFAARPQPFQLRGDRVGLEYLAASHGAVGQRLLMESHNGRLLSVSIGQFDRPQRSPANVDADDVARHGVLSITQVPH
jgi:hypothetical protein